MADFSTLIASIEATIKQNGVQAITGQVLQDELLLMVSAINQLKQDTLEGYAFYGEALPNGATRVVTQNTFFLAGAGSYTINGNAVTITDSGISVIVYDCVNDEITTYALFAYDANPTSGSGNAVTSGGVHSALAGKQNLVTTAIEGNLAEFDNAGQVRDAGIATSDVATKDGHYPDLFAGYAGNLVDTRSAGTPQGPYAFRQSGGDGVDYMVRIKGKTEAFNQLVQNGNFASTSGWTTQYSAVLTASANVGTLTLNARFGAIKQAAPLVAGHAYLFVATYKTSTSNFLLGIGQYNSVTNRKNFTATADGAWHTDSIVWSGADTTILTGDKDIFIGNREESAGSIDIKNICLFDLTLEGLGLTTADQFRALHPLPYYNYNAGVLKNNAATGMKTRGKNIFDEQWDLGYWDASGWHANSNFLGCKNRLPVLPNTAYYWKCPTNVREIEYWDAANNYLGRTPYGEGVANTTFTTPADCTSVTFYFGGSYGSVYKFDVCINLSSADFNGIYEPYWDRTLALPLNSIPCHDENNNAVVVNGLDGVGTSYDEAVVENGMVTKIIKRFAEVDLGDLEWTHDDAYGRFITADHIGIEQIKDGARNVALVCPKYVAIMDGRAFDASWDKVIYSVSGSVLIHDSSYPAETTGAQFKAAMDGVKLRYELATPKVLTLDNPFPALIEVDNLGTEKRLPEDTADNPQGPFECDSNYSISTANLVRKLSE